MKKLAVITVTHNEGHILKRYARSLKKALVGVPSETWIVDNDSNNETKDIIRGLKGFKIILNKKNLGFGRANNKAIRKAQSEYILILNPDTETPPSTIKKMIRYLDSHPKVGLLTCRVELFDGQLDRACRRGFPTPWRSICRMLYLDRLFPKTKVFGGYNLTYLPEDKISEIDSAVGAFMLVRSQTLEEIGLFDEAFFMYGEDIDLCYRIKERGWGIVYNPTAKILHYKGLSSGIKSHSAKLSSSSRHHRARMIRYFHDAMHIFYNKHYKNKYPDWLNKLIMAGINFKMQVALVRLKLFGY